MLKKLLLFIVLFISILFNFNNLSAETKSLIPPKKPVLTSDEFNKSEFNKNNNTYILDNLDNGDEYSIAIIPINLNGSGKPSNIISIIPKSNIKINIDN